MSTQTITLVWLFFSFSMAFETAILAAHFDRGLRLKIWPLHFLKWIFLPLIIVWLVGYTLILWALYKPLFIIQNKWENLFFQLMADRDYYVYKKQS